LEATLAADEALTRKQVHDHLARHLTSQTATLTAESDAK
jgi:hypothetical protein